MLAKVISCGISGLDVYPVTIEVDVSQGLPSTIIVGLPDSAVKESKERVRSAIKNSGYKYQPNRITISLYPSNIKKEGPSFDLAIALGILAATGQIDNSTLKNYIILGELSLDGRIHSINGAMSIYLSMSKQKYKGLILPAANAFEAALMKGIPIYPVTTLAETVCFLHDPDTLSPFIPTALSLIQKTSTPDIDFSDVKGQTHIKRGLEIAAAGGHNCILIGPPGSGKTMLAKRIPTILPDMTHEESIETTKIHSTMGLLPPKTGLISQRPFRSPHHTSSDVSLVGGGSIPRPGEITLSHNGILYLDELPEFNRNVIEALRQPLEDHYVTVSRALKTTRFPSKFMFVASMNPCPCGYYTDPKKECRCNPNQIQKYMSKISGPLLDRIDIHLEVPALKSSELLSPTKSEPSADIKARTTKARKQQELRFKDETPRHSLCRSEKSAVFTNAQMTHKQIKEYCILSDEGKNLLKMAIEELGLSARAHDKVLKVARTIADLDESAGSGRDLPLQPEHIAEAIGYRCLDRGWWG